MYIIRIVYQVSVCFFPSLLIRFLNAPRTPFGTRDKGVAANTVCACMYEYQRAGLPLPVYLKYFSKYHERQPIYVYICISYV